MQANGENLMDLNNKAELKKVWLEALRSGEYTQTEGTLHNLDTGGFCCLGVAAKVWGLASPEVMGVQGDEYGVPVSEGPTEIYDLLTKTVGEQEWEWFDGTKRLTRHKALEKGIGMNDDGVPFTEIADMIEREWDV